MSVTINTQAMKTRETPNDQWQPVMIMTEAEVNAVVQDTAPTGSEKVWFDTSDQSEVTVPTMADLDDVKDSLIKRATFSNLVSNTYGNVDLSSIVSANGIIASVDCSTPGHYAIPFSGVYFKLFINDDTETHPVLAKNQTVSGTVFYI